MIKTLSMLVAVLALAGSCRQQDLREITLHIPDMHNEACVRIVIEALSRAPGIQPGTVVVDPRNRLVRFTYDSLLVADKNFEHLVARAGFACNGIAADAGARAALPSGARAPDAKP